MLRRAPQTAALQEVLLGAPKAVALQEVLLVAPHNEMHREVALQDVLEGGSSALHSVHFSLLGSSAVRCPVPPFHFSRVGVHWKLPARVHFCVALATAAENVPAAVLLYIYSRLAAPADVSLL